VQAPNTSEILIDKLTNHPTKGLISKGFQNFQEGKIPTFIDSGASDTMFVSKEVFKDYKLVTPHAGDLAKVENGGFKIVGEENVIQQYQINWKEQEITYICVLHTPTLNANLISVSALNEASLITFFGNEKGVAWKADGTIILTSQKVNGMYLLETIDASNCHGVTILANMPQAMAPLPHTL
jgi:hypothetical protein